MKPKAWKQKIIKKISKLKRLTNYKSIALERTDFYVVEVYLTKVYVSPLGHLSSDKKRMFKGKVTMYDL